MIGLYRIIIPKRKDQSQEVMDHFWLLPTAARVYDGLTHSLDGDNYLQRGILLQTFSWRHRCWVSITPDEIKIVLLRSLSLRNPS